METTLLSVGGVIIMLLLGIIGFFIQRLVKAVDSVESAVNELRVVVGVQQSKFSAMDRDCSLKHGMLEKRLNKHSEQMILLKKDISAINQKLSK